MKPGPAMGRVLAELYEAQLDGRFSDLESGLGYLRRLNVRHALNLQL
jgi:hypothetical protein